MSLYVSVPAAKVITLFFSSHFNRNFFESQILRPRRKNEVWEGRESTASKYEPRSLI